jgi:hypothetical protein
MGIEPNNPPADSAEAGKSTNPKPACDEPVAPAAKDQTTIIDAKTCKTRICELLKCVDANFDATAKQVPKEPADAAAKPSNFKCKIMAVTPSKPAGSFKNQQFYPLAQKEWYPLGQADVTLANWAVIKEATCAALTREKPPHRREWYSPAVGLQVTLPADPKCLDAGQYMILMFFDTRTLEYYYYAKSTNTTATTYGKCCIDDNRPWRDILTNAGISLPPKSSSSN